MRFPAAALLALLPALALGGCLFFQPSLPCAHQVERVCEDLASADTGRRDAALTYLEQGDITLLKAGWGRRQPESLARCVAHLADLLDEPNARVRSRAIDLLLTFASFTPQRQSVVGAVQALADREWAARRPATTADPGSWSILSPAINALQRWHALRGREAWLTAILADSALEREAEAEAGGAPAYLVRHEARRALDDLRLDGVKPR